MAIGTRLASRSVLIFALRIFGAGFIFFVQAAIARAWGADALGDFILITAATSLLAVVLPLGFQTVGTYFTSQYRAHGQGRLLRRFLAFSYGHVLVAGVLVGLAGIPMTYLAGTAGELIRAYWWPIAAISIVYSLIYVNSTTLIGMKRPFAAYLTDMVARPVLTFGAFALALMTGEGVRMAPMLWLMVAGMGLLAVMHFAVTMRSVKQVPLEDGAVRPGEYRVWWRFATPWVLIVLASDYFFDINLLLLAELLDREELAIFGVSTRIFALVSFGVVAVYSLTMPDMFEAKANADRSKFASKLAEANLVATLLALGLFLGVLVFGRFVLMLFGDEFAAGATPMAILCLALVVRAMFGPASLVLSMQNKPYASLPSVALGLATVVVANYILVPPYGLMGAAISAFVAISVWSVSLWITALMQAKVDVSIFNRFRTVAV